MKIKKAYKVIISIVLIVGYIVASGIIIKKKYDSILCNDIQIDIDNNYAFVSKDVVLQMLAEKGIVIDSSVKFSEVNLDEIEKVINENIYVEETQAYGDFNGNIFLSIKQREPVIRVITEDTVSFYLDKKMKVMPLSDDYSADVMFLSGHLLSECFYASDSVDNYNVNNDKNSIKIDDICKFVDFLQSDELWRNQITQLYVNAANEFELVPRVGNHIILLGRLDGYETKMKKLKAMYDEGFDITGWNDYSIINLKFKDQVICKKRNNG